MGQVAASTVLGNAPAQVLAGIGCRRDTPAEEIVALVRNCLAEAEMPSAALVALATHTRKAGEPALHQAAAILGVPLLLLGEADLASVVPTPSELVRRHTGLPSIAEACALAAGPLLWPKRQTARVTCALGLCGPGWQLASYGQGAA